MHLCKVRVKSEVRITSLIKSHPLKTTIQGIHIPPNIISDNFVPKIQRLNLLRNVKDTVLISRRADHRTTKGIKAKLLKSLNGTSENTLSEALNNQKVICSDNKLKQFISRDD